MATTYHLIWKFADQRFHIQSDSLAAIGFHTSDDYPWVIYRIDANDRQHYHSGRRSMMPVSPEWSNLKSVQKDLPEIPDHQAAVRFSNWASKATHALWSALEEHCGHPGIFYVNIDENRILVRAERASSLDRHKQVVFRTIYWDETHGKAVLESAFEQITEWWNELTRPGEASE